MSTASNDGSNANADDGPPDIEEAGTLPTLKGAEGMRALPLLKLDGVADAVERERVFGALFTESSHSFELGRYVIMSTLGRGGMGVVFKAFDPTLDRLVALKVLHEGLDDKHTTRLRREAKALAKLSHPNVVQVYEVGEVDGQTFVAMEMVKGHTLREWMKQEARPDWRRCVEVFVNVGAGLAAAHEQGLVHRDFKPGNAIIDDKGRPRVLDFGLARQGDALEEENTLVRAHPDTHEAVPLDVSLTKTGTVLGTPAYMPPEQMQGQQADARSDQFSFCVALYEAIYGERPYAGSTLVALMVSMRTDTVEPAPKGSTVPASLRTVLLRGLASAPEDRWPTMEALLEQLRGVVAPRRRRGVALVGTVGLLAVGAGLGVPRYAEWKERCTGAQAEMEGLWDDARRQEVKAAILGTERSYASDTWERVEPRLDEYTEAWTRKHTEVCEATRLRGDQTEEAMGLRMGCLRTRRVALGAAVKVLVEADDTVVREAIELVADLPALDRCDDLDGLEQQRQRVPPPEEPQVAEEVEQLRERLAEIEAEERAGLYATALEHVEPVVVRAEALGYGPLLAEAKVRRGSLQKRNGRPAKAEQELTDAYTLAIEHDYEQMQFTSANSLVGLVGLGRHVEAKQWSRTALPLAQRIGEPKDVAASWGNLGAVLQGQGEYEDATVAYERALEIFEGALGSENTDVAQCWNNLGSVLGHQGHYEEAKAAHERVLEIRQKVQGAEHPDVATSWNNLAGVFLSRGEYEDAKVAYERAREIQVKSLGPEHPDMARTWNNLGNVLSNQGKYQEAKALHERALGIWEKALGAEHPAVANSWNNLGDVLELQGDYEQARFAYGRALEIFEKALGAEHPNIAAILANLGNVLSNQGEYEGAKAAHERALGIWEKTLGAEHPAVAATWNNLGSVLSNQGEYEDAKAAYRRALGIWEKALGAEHPDVANGWNNLGNMLEREGEYEDAKAAYRRALGIREKALGAEHPAVASPLVGLAIVAIAQDEPDTARTFAERAVSVREAGEQAPELLAKARFVLARALWSDRAERSRARTLAEQARDEFADAGKGHEDDLAEAEQWLAKHHVP